MDNSSIPLVEVEEIEEIIINEELFNKHPEHVDSTLCTVVEDVSLLFFEELFSLF